MAFDPALYNLITFNGLTEAFAPDGSWIIGIQNPTTETINYVKASDLLALITGTNNLPDGIISGIDQTVNNLVDPKVLSISAGQWRILNVVYNNNAPVNFNIPTADPTLDRIDRIYLDTTGVNYQVGTAGAGIPSIPADSIGLVPFTVPAGGGDITEPSPTLSAQYAVMNSLNTGDFDITGAFKVNGNPITLFTKVTITGTVDTDGNTDLTGQTGMPASGTLASGLRVYEGDNDYSQSASYNPTTQKVYTGLPNTTTIDILITF